MSVRSLLSNLVCMSIQPVPARGADWKTNIRKLGFRVIFSKRATDFWLLRSGRIYRRQIHVQIFLGDVTFRHELKAWETRSSLEYIFSRHYEWLPLQYFKTFDTPVQHGAPYGMNQFRKKNILLTSLIIVLYFSSRCLFISFPGNTMALAVWIEFD